MKTTSKQFERMYEKARKKRKGDISMRRQIKKVALEKILANPKNWF